jgi:uncharacterized membrane protein
MARKFVWRLCILLAVIVAFYPVIYFIVDRKFGLLSSKSADLLADVVWNAAFYTHIVLGGLALLIGWTQFNTRFRNKNLKLHRQLGLVYVFAVWISALAGIYIGFFATGGFVAAAGFISLGVVWFATTLMAYVHIKNKRIDQHQAAMIYSYAACFAAVTLRIWLPLLISVFGDFSIAYTIVSWLCWVPNIFVANRLVKTLVHLDIVYKK